MNTRKTLRIKRHGRIRARVSGSAHRPRLAVFRSNTSLYVQAIDDAKGKTLFSAFVQGKNIGRAQELGKQVAQMAKKHKVTKAVFDRGGFRYHGAVKALADSIREGGVTL